MFIREMRLDDLPFVMRVQRCCYHAIVPESQAVMESKLTIGPGCCFVCEENNLIVGYLLGHPWRSNSVIALHMELKELPPECDCLYLHDMAVLPEMRGKKIGEQLLYKFETEALRRKIRYVFLVAVQGAETFWLRMGYYKKNNADTIKLSSYGTPAFSMMKVLAPYPLSTCELSRKQYLWRLHIRKIEIKTTG